jgi:hypothetical protein
MRPVLDFAHMHATSDGGFTATDAFAAAGRAGLEEAEATIQELRQLMDQRGREAEVRDLLDAWASAVSDTLKIHGRFIRSLTGLGQPSEAPQRARPARGAQTQPKGQKRPRRPSS